MQFKMGIFKLLINLLFKKSSESIKLDSGVTAQQYENAKRLVKQYELNQEELFKNSVEKLKPGDSISLDMGGGNVETVTVSKVTPHPEVTNSFYYEFSNGAVCRDVRLH